MFLVCIIWIKQITNFNSQKISYKKIIREGKLGKKKETKGEVEFLEDGKLSNKRKGSVNFLFFTYILLWK